MSARLQVNVVYLRVNAVCLWVNVGMTLGQSGMSVGHRVLVSGSMCMCLRQCG